jgi:hypothetical protein
MDSTLISDRPNEETLRSIVPAAPPRQLRGCRRRLV